MSVDCLSPLDGRYARATEPIAARCSEAALIQYRIRVEVLWLIALADERILPNQRSLTDIERAMLLQIADVPAEGAAARVKEIEKVTNHDVKAVEYYLQERLRETSLRDILPWIHFACTSEDINNLAYARMLSDTVAQVYIPAAVAFTEHLASLAVEFADLPMLSRTHGQAATPTTLGKEIAVFVARLRRQIRQLESQEYLGKMNGAVGAFNAHAVAFPDTDWPAIAERFVRGSLGLTYNPLTTQIEPHDWIAELFHTLIRLQNIQLDFARDSWTYISLGYWKQRTVAGEVGSSTMPHKVNPIDFENAEANIGVSNALLEHLASKLAVSRLQRDLSDSSALRNVGSAIGYGYLALVSLRRGLGKIDVNADAIAADLASNPEVLAEAIQTVLRKHGQADAYERLKDLTRGARLDPEALNAFVATLDLPDDERARLRALTPATYVGLAPELARLVAVE